MPKLASRVPAASVPATDAELSAARVRGSIALASSTGASSTASDRLKWTFFGIMALCVLLVLWVDERFWFNAATDPHLQRIAAYKSLLLLHRFAGAPALTAGGRQMSSRIRRTRIALHRTLGKVYLGAVCF